MSPLELRLMLVEIEMRMVTNLTSDCLSISLGIGYAMSNLHAGRILEVANISVL